jgi:hypothetical protein
MTITDKIICTHKWGNNAPNYDEFTNSNGFILSCTYDYSIKGFKELVKIARKDFPFLKDSDIECFRVIKSSYQKGFPGVSFSLPTNKKKKGYRQIKRIDFDYY